MSVYLQCAVDLALPHQIPPRDALLIMAITALNVLCQIQFHDSQYNPLWSCPERVLLYHLEIDLTLLEHAIAINYQPDRQSLVIVPAHFVVFNDRFRSVATVLGGCRGM